MTNGEKIKEIFPDTKIITQYDNPFGDRFMVFTLNNEDMQVNIEWWNAEYKEPSIKNDLEVREFKEIVVEYPPEDLCTYPEYKGKPYFSIKYKEGNDCFIGYGTYKPQVLSRYLRDYFMPSVTPIRPKGHWREVDTNMYACSKCSHVLTIDPLDNSILGMNTCPFCSAKMEGIVDDKGRSKTLVRNRTENVGR